jgi:cadmium resistance transport/sequestration family protein
MDDLGSTLGTSIGIFASTNVDDIVVLTLLFLSARALGNPQTWEIWVGQYVGVGALVAISVVGALGLALVPERWVGLAGLLPLALGVVGLIRAVRARGDRQDPSPVVASGLLSVVGVTVANGADNISIYTPVFRTIGATASLITVAAFAVGVALWCAAGSWLGSHKQVVVIVERWGHWIVPIVFIAIGTFILIESTAS